MTSNNLFTYLTTWGDLQQLTEYCTGAPLALDCETSVRKEWVTKKGTALDPFTGEISLIIIKERDSQPVIIDLLALKQQPDYLEKTVPFIIDTLSAAEYLLGANLKFDLKFLRADLGVWFKKVFDVITASQLISNATGSKVGRQLGHGYADICRELLNVHITGKKDLRVSSWGLGIEGRTLGNEWWFEKLKYAANDVKYLFYIEDIQRRTLTEPMPHTDLRDTHNILSVTQSWGLGMEFMMNLEMEFVPVIAQMEYNGMPTGVNMMTCYQEQVKNQLIETATCLSEELNLDMTVPDLEGRRRPTERVMTKLRSPAGLLFIINEALNLKKIDSTQAETLKRLGEIIDILSQLEDASPEDLADIFVDNDEAELYEELLDLQSSDLVELCPIVNRILEFKKLTKQDGMDLRKYINPATGRIHANYSQLGAATGRLSASGPNMQQQSGRTTLTVQLKKEDLFT
jgi:DNA polymerase I-like protein with 3'-5' exonuclease and polymerase domains